MHKVVALVHPPALPFELAIVSDVFGRPRPDQPPKYTFELCALSPGPNPTTAGYDILVPRDLSALDEADTIVIPGWPSLAQPASAKILMELSKAHARGARILAICTAAFVLAEAGLLDGRRATTHWRAAKALADRYRRVRVDEKVLYIDHGDVATSAGTAAGIDLCLHIVRKDQGAAYAARIARDMVLPPQREGGQSQYAYQAEPKRPYSLAPVLEWATKRLGTPLTVADLARRGNTSPRTLARWFQTEFGTGPGQWLLGQRVDAARELLESGDMPVEAIARKVGLSSALNLRRHFRARLGTTPSAYRRAFRVER